MKIVRRSVLSNAINEMDIPVTEEQIAAWERGMLIQVAMPKLTPDQREFIKTGITPDEWDTLFDAS